jgi:hypothetical protein
MTQNFNIEQISFSNMYKGADFAFSNTIGDTVIYLHADSNNNIYRAQYEASEAFKPYLELICAYTLDKNIDDLIRNLTNEFSSEEMSSDKQFLIQYSLLAVKESLLAYIGEGRSFSDIDANEIICRCTHIDNLLLKQSFNKFKGNKTEILKATNMGLICGSCRSYGNEKMKSLIASEEYYEGKSFDEWSAEIGKSIEEFGFYSPEEFSGAIIEIDELKLPVVALNIKGHSDKLDERFAVRSLNNYLAQELKTALEIQVRLN